MADVVSKFMAVLLLPVYTRYISPAGYGVVELLGNGVIFISILVRFGIIESFLRFYFTDEDRERRDALVRRSFLFLLVTTTIASIVLAALAGAAVAAGARPPRRVDLPGRSAGAVDVHQPRARLRRASRRRAAADLRDRVGDERRVHDHRLGRAGGRARQGPRGLLLGNYGVSTLVLLALWWTMRERLRPRPGQVGERLPALMRFGLPTVPAEVSVYALSIVDRYYIYHDRSPRLAGLYSIAVKLAGAVAFIVRAFQYAWPPLAYSVDSDVEAARLYGLVTTYYVIVSGWVVAGLALLGRWVLRLLTAPSYFEAYRALPWVALGWAMYGLWVVFLVIAGRAKVTTRNFPASLAGLVANVILLVLLVPTFGIAGAGHRPVRRVRGDARR